MLGIFGAIAALISIIIISVWFCLRERDKKFASRFLVVSWILCLALAGTLLAIQASETYVASTAVYRGYWYEVGTGRYIRPEYDRVGGEGSSPVMTSILAVFSFAIVGLGIGYGISVLFSKKRSVKAKVITLIAFAVIIIITIINVLRR